MPRARSSGALSIWSYATKAPPFISAITLVSAAVSVVLPWSTCPIVPTFTCGLVRSNFPLAIAQLLVDSLSCRFAGSALGAVRGLGVDHGLGDVARRLGVMLELHRVRGAALGQGPQRGRVAEHLRQRH